MDDMALQIPSKRFHFRSLANALSNVRSSLMYITDALRRWDDEDWPFVEDTIARELSTSTMTLEGIMEGLVFDPGAVSVEHFAGHICRL